MKLFQGPSYYVLGNHESCGAIDIDKDGIRAVWHHLDDNPFIPDNSFEFDYPEQNLRFIVLDSQYEPDGTDKSHFALATRRATFHASNDNGSVSNWRTPCAKIIRRLSLTTRFWPVFIILTRLAMRGKFRS